VGKLYNNYNKNTTLNTSNIASLLAQPCKPETEDKSCEQLPGTNSSPIVTKLHQS